MLEPAPNVLEFMSEPLYEDGTIKGAYRAGDARTGVDVEGVT